MIMAMSSKTRAAYNKAINTINWRTICTQRSRATMSNSITDSLLPRPKPLIRVRLIPAGAPFVQSGLEIRPPTPDDRSYVVASEDLVWRTGWGWEPPSMLLSATPDRINYTVTPTLNPERRPGK
jgi:hypothetical protein